MKMLWYCLSGNIELLCREIPFESLNLKTESYELIIEPHDESKRIRVHYSSKPQENHSWILAASSSSKSLPDPHEKAFQNETALTASAYFPTFRRFDGGYGCDSAVQKVIRDWSHSLCKGNHSFITSIELNDIGDLLNREYSLRTKRLNERIDEIIHNSNTTNQNSLNTISEEKSVLLKPFDVLPKLVSQILGYPGIRIENSIPIGDEKNAIKANYLSLGEKQMLSFLCYNIFLKNASIFIDEPENSLHPDWQRQLIPTLLEQSTHNQFIIATHSPFIYSMYSDKELNLNEDRGGK
jgi:predicted ATP-dependent endonuclease of OLD family